MIESFEGLLQAAQGGPTLHLAVAAAQDADVLQAVCQGAQQGLCIPHLVGDVPAIEALLTQLGHAPDAFALYPAETPEECAALAVELVRQGKANCLMKGLMGTADLLRAVVDKERGLRTGKLLSHVMLYQVPGFPRLLYLTDGGMNTYPDVEQKAQIIENAGQVCRAMGLAAPKVACICGAETVSPKIQATVDAAALQEDTARFGPQGLLVAGPMGLDLAISPEACHHKGYTSPVGGAADVLLVPTYEVGNGIGKSLTYFAGAKSAGLVVGARVPIVLVSRADTAESKLYSIALGSLVARQA